MFPNTTASLLGKLLRISLARRRMMSTTCRDLAGSRLPTPSEHVARAQVADAQTLDIDIMCATRLAFAERAGVTPRASAPPPPASPPRRCPFGGGAPFGSDAPAPSRPSPRRGFAPGARRAAHLPHDEGEGAGRRVRVPRVHRRPEGQRAAGAEQGGGVVRVRERQGWRGWTRRSGCRR